MSTIKKVTLFILLYILNFTLVKADSEKTLYLNIYGEPVSLNPHIARDINSGNIIKHIFEGLMTRDENNKLTLGIASKYIVSKDGLLYTFTIRDDAYWSNGDEVTAHDYIYSLRKLIQEGSVLNPSFQEFLFYIKNSRAIHSGEMSIDEAGLKLIDDKTFSIEIESITPYFLEMLQTLYIYLPVYSKVDKENPNWASNVGDEFVTNGPYILKEWVHNDKIVLTKNPYYYDKDSIDIDNIVMYMIDSHQSAMHMFDRGQLSWLGAPYGTIPPESLQILKEKNRLVSSPTIGTYWLAFNTNKYPFNNVNIRKAFSLAINRDDIVSYILQGGQRPALGIVSSATWSDNIIKEDIFKKDALSYLETGMQELGIKDIYEFPHIKYTYNNSELHQKIAIAIQDMWKNSLGILVELEAMETKVYFDQRNQGNFQIIRAGWYGAYNDAMAFLEIFYDKNRNNNYGNWYSEEFTSLISEARSIVGNKRIDAMKKAEKILIDDMPIAPIFFHSNDWIQTDKLKNVHVTPLGEVYFKHAKLED